MVNIIPKDFCEDAALYIVTLYFGSMVEINNVGYNCKATRASNKAIVSEEKINASIYLFFETSRGTFATAKNESIGVIK